MVETYRIPEKKESRHEASIVNVSRAIYLEPLRWKVGILCIGTLLFSTNVSSFFTESMYSEEFAFVEESVEYEATASSKEGFLAKPSIQNSESQRVGMSDILKYTVNPGDSISYIAARFNISPETVANANRLSKKSILKVGQEILILPVDGILYKVQKEDTLDKISKKYNVDKTLILAQNNIKDEKITNDESLIIPGAKPIIVPSEQPTARFASINFNPTKPSITNKPVKPVDTSNIQSTGDLLWPVAGGGRITQKSRAGHVAIDITYGNGNLHPGIVAADSGVVVQAEKDYGYHGGYGNVIVIDHGDGTKTRYAHNNEVLVSVGDAVKKGQIIAKMGNTGRVYGKTGIHLHFEVIKNGQKKNPLLYY